MSQEIAELIRDKALDIGFNDIKFIEAKPLLESEQHFLEWRAKGYAADMNYLLKDDPINARPEYLLENARTLIMMTANYYSPCPPRPSLEHGRIAAYAVGLDYHKVLKQKLKLLMEDPEIREALKHAKFFTDAVPLLEKSFAKRAGLGFQGRNTLLISRETGSFNFIVEIITDLVIEESTASSLQAERSSTSITNEIASSPSAPRNDSNCGKCTRCMDICPTNALPNEYQLDARKCISYHTIENRGEIPEELAKNFGEWVFGCDLCQTICPYNRNEAKILCKNTFPEFSPTAGFGHWLYLPEIIELQPGKHKSITELIDKLETHKFIDDQAFTQIKKFIGGVDILDDELYDKIFQIKFARTPLLRPKRKGLIRNAEIVLKNSGF
jgi:epoxyqueuosine reductase